MFYLGIDSGTQSTKCIALELATGQVVASAQSSYGLIPGLPPGHLEQPPETWVEACETAVRAVPGAARRPAQGGARHRRERPAARPGRPQRRERTRPPGQTVVRHLHHRAVRAVHQRIRRGGRDHRPDRQRDAARLHRAENPLAQAKRAEQLPPDQDHPPAARLPQLLAHRREAHGIRRRLRHGDVRRAHAPVVRADPGFHRQIPGRPAAGGRKLAQARRACCARRCGPSGAWRRACS